MSKVNNTKILPSVEQLRECFVYDPDTGEVQWKFRPRWHFRTYKGWATWNANNAGNRAGNVNSNGHRRVLIDSSSYLEHRVIWKLMTEEEPVKTIDHRDGNHGNNAWNNLRSASHQEQKWNAKVREDNKTGYRGVFPSGNRWAARISMNGRYQHIGCFSTAKEAAIAYENMAQAFQGEFYRKPGRKQ